MLLKCLKCDFCNPLLKKSENLSKSILVSEHKAESLTTKKDLILYRICVGFVEISTSYAPIFICVLCSDENPIELIAKRDRISLICW